MPQKEQLIAVDDVISENVLPVILKTLADLNWEIAYVDAEKIVANTTPNAIKGTQVTCLYANNTIQVISKMVQGEMVDIGNKNQKAIDAFKQKLSVNKNITDDVLEQYKQQLEHYKGATVASVEQYNKEMEEVQSVMNTGSSNLYATYIIIAINIIVFILMALDGAGIMDTNGYVHLKWGSNFGPLTLSGDWWRLITSTFIHFGIIHIAMNMYCLYSVGIYLEPMLGKVKYVTAYICTGIIASLVSLWWHTVPANSAGASGAVFGMYGLFLAFLTSNIIPKIVRDALLKSIGIFVVFNLAYGMKSGVDNAAHIGGLISGFVIGYIFVLIRKKERTGAKFSWVVPIIVLLTGAITYYYLQKNKNKGDDRAAILKEIKSHSGNYKDLNKYNEAMKQLSALEKDAISFLEDSTLSDVVVKSKIETISLPNWAKAKELMQQSSAYNVSPELQNRSKILVQYADYRMKESNALLQYLDGKNKEQSIRNVNEARKNISDLLVQINSK